MMKATYKIAMAAGRDAANRLMLEKGLTRWDKDCWNRLCEVFDLLYSPIGLQGEPGPQ